MAIEIKAPTFPESVADGTVATWHKQPGDAVKRDELIVDIETDKVVMEVLAEADGVLTEIVKNEGDTVLSGELLGKLIGVPANVGGVGIAMVLLILVGSYLKNRGLFKPETEQGVKFWSAVYIPIVVAMAAQQNVYGALAGGPMAILAGVAAVALAFALVPVLDRIGRKKLEAAPSDPSDPVDQAKPLTSSARG
mgnify:CR=1 FL=1